MLIYPPIDPMLGRVHRSFRSPMIEKILADNYIKIIFTKNPTRSTMLCFELTVYMKLTYVNNINKDCGQRCICTQFLQRLHKILSCLLPITLTVHLGHTHWRLLILVCFENCSFFNPEQFNWCQTLQILQHMPSIFPTFVLHCLHFRRSIFLLIGEGYEGWAKCQFCSI